MFCKHELEHCHQCDACQMPYDELCCDWHKAVTCVSSGHHQSDPRLILCPWISIRYYVFFMILMTNNVFIPDTVSWQTVMPSFPVAFHWSGPWPWQSSLWRLCSLFMCSIGGTWRGPQSVGLNLCLSAHSGDICDLLLVDSLRFLLTTGLCVSQTAKSSQLCAIRLQNAGDVHSPLQSIKWWGCGDSKSVISFLLTGLK